MTLIKVAMVGSTEVTPMEEGKPYCMYPPLRYEWITREDYDALTMNDIVEARELMNNAPPPAKMSARTEWKFSNTLGQGTEPMNTTTVEVKTTERTADDIIKAVREGKYITNNGSLIVSSGYNSIRVAVNPLNACDYRGNNDKSMNLNEDTLLELTSVISIVTAERKISNATDTKEWAAESMNIEARGK